MFIHNMSAEPSERSRARRGCQRAPYDRPVSHAMPDSGIGAHIAFAILERPQRVLCCKLGEFPGEGFSGC